MNDVMLDLETLGNRPNAVIVAIGAVKFNALELGESFYVRVDPRSCVAAGLEMDVETVQWWLAQSDEARKEITAPGIPLSMALAQFTGFLDHPEYRVWGNGAAFDNVIMASAYRAFNLPSPWRFWNDRCYRTVKGMFPAVALKRGGTHHNALDDAMEQAEIFARLFSWSGR